MQMEALKKDRVGYDRSLFITALMLLMISVVLIATSSIMESSNLYGDEFFLLKKHVISIGVAVVAGVVALTCQTKKLERGAFYFMIIVVLMLIAVLIVGRSINGAKRWLPLGLVNLQPAELLKLCWLIYISSFVSRKMDEVRSKLRGFIKPAFLIAILAFLLLKQPDLGSLIVVGCLCGAVLWIAGSPLLYYLGTLILVGIALAAAIITSPYRMSRVTSFMDPWADQFGAGYQLTQSLMAFGRGGLFGQGLGNSLQKLGYLPEAHTDFVTSILGEEFGFIGMCVVILLEFFIVFKALHLGFNILRKAPVFQGFLASGIGVWFCVQTTINIGVASGGLPTKGLTLPLVSFGGSSMIVFCMAIGILLRIDFETRHGQIDFSDPAAKKEEKKNG